MYERFFRLFEKTQKCCSINWQWKNDIRLFLRFIKISKMLSASLHQKSNFYLNRLMIRVAHVKTRKIINVFKGIRRRWLFNVSLTRLCIHLEMNRRERYGTEVIINNERSLSDNMERHMPADWKFCFFSLFISIK